MFLSFEIDENAPDFKSESSPVTVLLIWLPMFFGFEDATSVGFSSTARRVSSSSMRSMRLCAAASSSAGYSSATVPPNAVFSPSSSV